MSIQIRQFQSDAQTNQDFYDLESYFWSGNGYAAVDAGDTLVALVVMEGFDVHITSFTDDAGNTWEQVPGAYISVDDLTFAHTLDVWIAKNAASTASAPFGHALHVHFEMDQNVTNGMGIGLYNIVGPADVVAVGNISGNGAPTTRSGPSLAAGNRASVYLAISNGVFDQVAAPDGIESPWSDDTDAGNFQNRAASTVASLVSTGTQQPIFNATAHPTRMFAIVAVALSNEASPDTQSTVFLGSVRVVDGAPNGPSNPFLGTVKVIDAVPGGRSNPYLGTVVVGTPGSQTDPSLGEVVVVTDAPEGNTDSFLGTVSES
jgi:hypothetical protein